MKQKVIHRAYGDMARVQPRLLPLTVANNIIASLRPFVNIIFPAKMIDELIGAQDVRRLVSYALTCAVLNLLLFVIQNAFASILNADKNQVYVHEKNSISEKLMQVDYAALENSAFAAKVAQHRDEAEREWGIFGQCLFVVEIATASLCSMISSIILMWGFWAVIFKPVGDSFWESTWLGVIALVGTVLLEVSIAILFGKLNQGTVTLRKEYAGINRIFEHYRNMITDYKTGKEIRIFHQQPFILRHAADALLSKGVKLQSRIANRYVLSYVVSAALSSMIILAFYLLIGIKARAGLYSIGDMVIYIGGFLQILQASKDITMIFGQFKSITPKVQLYYEILDTPINHASGTELPDDGQHTIEYRNLSFRYGENMELALRDVNITIHPGERIAIVGENGSGKTTFIKLLCRLYDATEGAILLDGNDITTYDETAYQSLFSVVFQDYSVFSLPLGENVAVGSQVNADHANDCLAQVGFPAKYGLETYLYRDCDENGIEISGGEAQKLALARALYRNSPYIILDEPTAALDPIAEFELYSKFDELVSGKTTIYISHRLSSCYFCDKVAVFEHGRLTQFGTHDELIKNEFGKYYELWNTQAKYYINTKA